PYALRHNQSTMPLTCSDIPKLICSLIIPPIGVFIEKGCSVHLAINILLTLLGYIPGLIHAIIIICYY
ncbi:Protein W02A2.9, partial [Aphelenchoides avenae]